MLKNRNNKSLFYQLNATAIPLILSSVVNVIMGIIDQAFIGHISIYAYAGVGLVLSCINSIVGVLGAFSIVFNIQGSKLSGEKNYQELNNLFSCFCVICFAIGAILTIIFNLFCDSILTKYFGLTGEVLIEAGIYLKVYSISIPLNLLIFILSSTLKIFKQTKYLFVSSIIVNIINVVLDYALVFGKLCFPRLETLGAALGTIIALIINLLIYLMLARKYVKFSVNIPNLKKRVWEMVSYSLPFIAQEAMEDVIFIIGINSVVAKIGVLELSTYSLITQIANIFLMPMFGYATANTIFVGESNGKKQYEQVFYITKQTICSLLIWFVALYLLLICFDVSIVDFITNDKSVIYYTSKVLPLALFIHLFNYYFSVCKSTLQCLGYEKWTLLVAFAINLSSLIMIFISGNNLISIYSIMGIGYFLISVIYSKKLLFLKKHHEKIILS